VCTVTVAKKFDSIWGASVCILQSNQNGTEAIREAATLSGFLSRLLFLSQERTACVEGSSSSRGPRREKEYGREEKGVQEDDLKRQQQQPAQTHTHTHERPPSRENSKNEPRVLRAIDSLGGGGGGGGWEVRVRAMKAWIRWREGGRRGGAGGRRRRRRGESTPRRVRRLLTFKRTVRGVRSVRAFVSSRPLDLGGDGGGRATKPAPKSGRRRSHCPQSPTPTPFFGHSERASKLSTCKGSNFSNIPSTRF